MFTSYMMITDLDTKGKIIIPKDDVILVLHGKKNNRSNVITLTKQWVCADQYQDLRKLLLRREKKDDRKNEWLETKDFQNDHCLILKSEIASFVEDNKFTIIELKYNHANCPPYVPSNEKINKLFNRFQNNIPLGKNNVNS